MGRFSIDNCFRIQNTEFTEYTEYREYRNDNLYAQVADAAETGELMFGTVDSWLVWNLTGGLQGGKYEL